MKTNIYITLKLIINLIISLFVLSINSFAQVAPHANFDATNGSFIDIGKGTSLNCINTLSSGDQMTIAMWIKWTSKTDPNVGSWANILTLADSTGSGDNGVFWVQHNQTNTKFEFALHSSSRTYVQSTTNPIEGRWYHLVCVYDGSRPNKNLKLYVDGYLEVTANLTGNIRVTPAASRLNMGRWSNSANNYRRFFGLIDEVSIWNIALNQGQINQIISNPESVIGESHDAIGLIGYWSFDDYSANDLSSCNNNGHIGSSVQLPISLLYFKAKLENNRVKLSWSTVSEVNNDYFTIERSLNGYDYEAIGIVNGVGFSSIETKYELIDDNPILGVLYYRLKQTDFDGVSSYYEIKSVDVEDIKIQDIIVYPNPCSSLFNLNLNQFASEVNIDIFNSNGDKVLNRNYFNSNNIYISVENFKSGIYFAKINVDNKIFTQRIIINNF